MPQLDKYELLEEIGHGGMATVYRAHDLRLGRDVAVKLIHKHLRENAEVRRRFVSEARAVAKLRHPGIVDVYDVSDDEEPERYLVVELIRGSSLRQVLQRLEVLPAEIAACVGSILCDAVEHAHDCGVIHRDIKPENVLLEIPGGLASKPARESADSSEAPTDPEPGDERPEPGDRASQTRGRARTSERPSSGPHAVTVKLTDFGIAKVLDAQGVTSTGQILGSPAHMAPEQIEGGNVGPHTDVFALGVLLYECMVGHLPFEGKNPAQVLRRVLEGSFEPADSERPTVGGRWARILAAALEVDADRRVPSAAELGRLIDEELSALGVDDARAELGAFFADPDGYRERQKRQLVPRLLARGERERRAGRVQGAAADFNRALALCPDDLAILKRVSALSAETLWRDRAIMLAKIGAVAAVLFAGAYGVTRLATSAPDESEPAPTATLATVAPSASAPAPELPSARASASPPPPSTADEDSRESADSDAANTATVSAPRPPQPGPSSSAQAAAKVRKVRFHVEPAAARLEVDGREVSWYGQQFELSIGNHPFRAWMPASDPCCRETAGTAVVTAPPEDKPDEVQILSIRLPLHPANAMLTGAPAGGGVTCNNGLTLMAGGSSSVAMHAMQTTVTCTFTPGGKTTQVTFRAGGSTAIPWKGD